MIRIYATAAVVPYLLGSIPFGYVLVKLFLKQDIRQTGSGNIGATNVARSGRKGLAIATLLLDAGKGALAVAIADAWFRSRFGSSTVLDCWPCHSEFQVMALAALSAVIGHMFPVWLKFKGGKGVATALGSLSVLSPALVAACVLVFLITFGVTRFVSLGSIVAAISVPLMLLTLWWGHPPFRDYLSIIFISALVLAKHHQNIRRLLSGTEPKFGARKAVPADSIEAEKNA